MKKLALLASSLAVFSAHAVSSDVYLGGKLGNSWLDDSCFASSPCDDSSFGGGIFAGYNFSETYALEAGYDYLGGFESNFQNGATVATIDDSARAFTLAPKFTLALDEGLSLFAKLGAARVDYQDVNDFVLLAGLGAEYALSSDWAARLEYQRINNIEDDFVEDMDIDSVFVGLTYKFGKKAAMLAPVAMAVVEPAPEPVVEVVEEPAPAPEPEIKMFEEFGTELFDTDSYKLAKGSEQYFDWLIGVMKKYPQANATVVGHTDSRGSEAYNQKLSENRAQAVANYLFTQGIEESRVTVIGAGETKPKASNDTVEGRLENRRVEVTIEEFEYQD
jgi:OOP family OmpA-OmpF porin